MGLGKKVVSINITNPLVKDMYCNIKGIRVIHSNSDRAARNGKQKIFALHDTYTEHNDDYSRVGPRHSLWT